MLCSRHCTLRLVYIGAEGRLCSLAAQKTPMASDCAFGIDPQLALHMPHCLLPHVID